MGNNIKGITVELGGDTTKLSAALKDVNKTSGDLSKELRQINTQLKFDPGNVDLLRQKQDVLKQSTEALREKQATLKTALEQVKEQYAKGDLGADKVRAVEREYEKVNSQLKDTQKELTTVSGSVGSFSDKCKSKFSELKTKIKDTFSSENIKAGIGAIGIAVGGFLKSTIETAGAAQKTNADLEATLKSTKGAAGMTKQSLDDLAGSLQRSSIFTAGQVKQGEAMLLTFTNIGSKTFPAATKAVLDFAQKMGVEPKQAALQLGKALNDPATGLSKLTKSGVTFTEQQKKQITAMQKAGDTAGAQKLMIDELNKEFGGQAAAAANTYEGRQKQLNNTLNATKATIGNALLPTLAKIASAIAPVIAKIAEFVQKNPQLTAGILAVVTILGTLIGGLSLLTTVTAAFGITLKAAFPVVGIVAAITAGIVALVLAVKHLWDTNTGFRTAVINIWNGIKAFFSTIGTFFGTIFNGIVNAVKSVVTFFQTLPQFFSGLWTTITTALQNFWNSVVAFFTQGIPNLMNNIKNWFMKLPENIGYVLGFAIGKLIQWGAQAIAWAAQAIPQLINNIGTFFSQLPGKIWNFLVQAFTKITTWGGNCISYVASNFPRFVQSVVSFFQQLPGRIWTELCKVVTNIGNWISNMGSFIASNFPRIVSSIVGFFASIPGKMLDIGGNIVQGIWNGISGAASWLWNQITGFCNGIVNGIKGALGIHSPSRVMADVVGKNMVLGIGQGFADNMQSVTSTMSDSLHQSINGLTANVPVTANIGTRYANGVMQSAQAGAAIVQQQYNINVYASDINNPKRTAQEIGEQLDFLQRRKAAAYGTA